MSPARGDVRDPGSALLAWYRTLGREMPWRGHPEPYAVWVSEIMLQQTTVAAVTPRFSAFLELFPDVIALAEAEEEEVLAAVAGLGYYRRFRALHRAARFVRDERGGELPRDAEGWRSLPGIGDYTAGAIASIAHGERAAAVDGNVVRVLTRLDAREGRHDGVAARRALGDRVLEIMPAEAPPGDFTQALFDLGREVCTPRDPKCLLCPWNEPCRARVGGDPARFPETAPRTKPQERLVVQGFLRRGDEVLLRRRPESASRMPGFWEFPEAWGDPDADLDELLGEALGRPGRTGSERARARHAITRYRLDCRLIEVETRPSEDLDAIVAGSGESDGLLWCTLDAVEERAQPLSTISRKLLRKVQRDG